MKQTLRRILAGILVLLLLSGPASAVFAEETDEVLAWAKAKEILTGSLAEAPGPDQPCSRGEAAVLLWRFAGRPEPEGECGFPDVIPAAYYAKAVAWAAETELVLGCGDGLYHPNLLCSRAGLCVLLWRQAGRPVPADAVPVPGDVGEGDANRTPILWAIGSGLLTADAENRFSPYTVCTRGEVLTALFRLDRASLADSPKRLVVIDPGHQSRANTDREPLGPGSTETKGKVSGGTYGSASGLAEYELTLIVSLQLRDELERRGYEVRLTRETHDVDISNKERAEFANALGADCAVRIHANGSSDPAASGALTINMTKTSPFNAWLYPQSRALSEALLDGMCAATGATPLMIWDTDTMVGVNWSQVPVSIVEMGYMTNPAEDLLMASPEYQAKLVRGLADGLDAWFAAQEGP